jgi:hypothetical protein
VRDGVNSNSTTALPDRLSNSDAVTHHADSKIKKYMQPLFFFQGIFKKYINKKARLLKAYLQIYSMAFINLHSSSADNMLQMINLTQLV